MSGARMAAGLANQPILLNLQKSPESSSYSPPPRVGLGPIHPRGEWTPNESRRRNKQGESQPAVSASSQPRRLAARSSALSSAWDILGAR